MADLDLKVRLDSSEATQQLRDIRNSINDVGKQVQQVNGVQMFVNSSRELNAFAGNLKSIGRAFSDLIMEQAKEIREFEKMSIVFNRTIDELDALDKIAKKTGLEGFNQMANLAGRMSAKLADSNGVLTTAGQNMTKLGIAVVGVDGKMNDSLTTMEETTKALMAMENKSQAVAMAMQFGGRAYAAHVRQMLALGSSYDEAKAKMEAYGVSTQAQTRALANMAKASADFKNIWDEMNERTAGQLAQVALPLFEKLNNVLRDLAVNSPNLSTALGVGSVVIGQWSQVLDIVTKISLMRSVGNIGNILSSGAGSVAANAGGSALGNALGAGAGAGIGGALANKIGQGPFSTAAKELMERNAKALRGMDSIESNMPFWKRPFGPTYRNAIATAGEEGLGKVGMVKAGAVAVAPYAVAAIIAGLAGNYIPKLYPGNKDKLSTYGMMESAKVAGNQSISGFEDPIMDAIANKGIAKLKKSDGKVVEVKSKEELDKAVKELADELHSQKGTWGKLKDSLFGLDDSTREARDQLTLQKGPWTVGDSKRLQGMDKNIGRLNAEGSVESIEIQRRKDLIDKELSKPNPDMDAINRIQSGIATGKPGQTPTKSADIQNKAVAKYEEAYSLQQQKVDIIQKKYEQSKAGGKGAPEVSAEELLKEKEILKVLEDKVKQEKEQQTELQKKIDLMNIEKQIVESQSNIKGQESLIRQKEQQINQAKQEDEMRLNNNGLMVLNNQVPTKISKLEIDKIELSRGKLNDEQGLASQQYQKELLQGVPKEVADNNLRTATRDIQTKRDALASDELKVKMDQFKKSLEEARKSLVALGKLNDAKSNFASVVGDQAQVDKMEGERQALAEKELNLKRLEASMTDDPNKKIELNTAEIEEKIKRLQAGLQSVAKVFENITMVAKASASAWQTWAGVIGAKREAYNLATGKTDQMSGLDEQLNANRQARAREAEVAQAEYNKTIAQINLKVKANGGRETEGTRAERQAAQYNLNTAKNQELSGNIGDQTFRATEGMRIYNEELTINKNLLISYIELNKSLNNIDKTTADYLISKDKIQEALPYLDRVYSIQQKLNDEKLKSAQYDYQIAMANDDLRDNAQALNDLERAKVEWQQESLNIAREQEKTTNELAVRMIENAIALEEARLAKMEAGSRNFINERNQTKEIIRLKLEEAKTYRSQGKEVEALRLETEALNLEKKKLTIGQELLIAGGDATSIDKYLKQQFPDYTSMFNGNQMDANQIAKDLASSTFDNLYNILDTAQIEKIGAGDIIKIKEALQKLVLSITEQVFQN